MIDVTQIHSECGRIFREMLIDSSTGKSLACKMYDKIAEEGDCADCLGENFNQLIHKVNNNWFHSYTPSGDWDYYFMNYTLLLYLFYERIEIVFSVLNKDGKSKLFNDFHFQNFRSLHSITKWANFFKHPKEYLFTHWPQYYFEGTYMGLQVDDVVINTDFILKHYSSEKDPRPTQLENNNKVYVEIPDLINLTTNFCKEMLIFFDFIVKNQIVADFLKKKSTIKYLSEQETELETPAVTVTVAPSGA